MTARDAARRSRVLCPARATGACTTARRRGFFERFASRQALSRAVVERRRATLGVVLVTELMTGVQRAIVIVDGVAQLAERGTARIGVGVGVTIAVVDAGLHAAVERRQARRAVSHMPDFVTVVRGSAAAVGLVTQLADHGALGAAIARAGLARCAGRGRYVMVIVVVVIAAGREEKATRAERKHAEIGTKFGLHDLNRRQGMREAAGSAGPL